MNKYTVFGENIKILAINKQVASMCVLANHIDLLNIVEHISINLIDTKLPSKKHSFLCRSKNLIAN